MVSTLKLTKIQIPNSDSDVISLDASTGNVTLNKTLGGTSITVQGEGTNTTDLQQGLAKIWVNFDGSGGMTPRDSFNVGSITDAGTGSYQVIPSNNMGNANYTVAGSANDNAGIVTTFSGTYSASSVRVLAAGSTNGAASDWTIIGVNVHGDLA